AVQAQLAAGLWRPQHPRPAFGGRLRIAHRHRDALERSGRTGPRPADPAGPAPAPRLGRQRLIDRNDRAAHVGGVEVGGRDVLEVDRPDGADPVALGPLARSRDVADLEADHVAAVTVVALEPAGR